jgi:hypothetical protein
MRLVKNDLNQVLSIFRKNHPTLNPKEQTIIQACQVRLANKNESQERALLTMIQSLRILSLNQELSTAGRLLLKKLQRKQWLWGLLNQSPFFGR